MSQLFAYQVRRLAVDNDRRWAHATEPFGAQLLTTKGCDSTIL